MHASCENDPRGSLRVMVREDLPDVLRIEAASFADPWSQQDFADHLENPDSVALVIERGRSITAYEIFGFRGRWIQLHSCVVHPAFRRDGLGSSLVAHLMRIAAQSAPGGVLVKVPERNVDAQLFFRHCGFRATRVLAAYLRADQDVYVMKYSVPEWASADFDLRVPEDELIPYWEVKHGCLLGGTRVKTPIASDPIKR
jgi:ribosomal-protein-alanine N-acetyltransferase